MRKWKKILLAIVLTLLVTTMLFGCSETDRSANSLFLKNKTARLPEVPFIVLNENNEEINAYLFYWDLESKRIKQTSEIVYKISKKTAGQGKIRMKTPISCDGQKYLVLPDYAEVADKYAQTVERVKLSSEPRTIWGAYAKLIKSNEKNRYTLTLWDGKKRIEKEVKLPVYSFKGKDGKEYKTEEYGTVTAIKKTSNGVAMLYPCFTPEEAKLFVVKYDCVSDRAEWREIVLPPENGLSPSLPPLADQTAVIGDSFFIRTIGNPAEVNVEKASFRTMKNISDIQKKYASETLRGEFPEYIDVFGSFNDILFISIPMHKATGLELYVCALKNDEIVGLIHRTLNGFDVIDTAGKITASYNIAKSSSLIGENDIYLPNLNGMD